MKIDRDAPIGVFDSGVGGLTVAREIMRNLPSEKIVYFGDTARVPYGSKSKDTVIRYSRQIIHFLEEQQVKAIVIACNTASAFALDAVKDELNIPVLGVIEAGAKVAAKETRNKRVGVIGTLGTVGSGIHEAYLKQLDPEITVIGKACPLFVPLVENGHFDTKVAELVTAEYLEEVKKQNVDTLIMGCTHYPLLKKTIGAFMGESVTLIDAGAEVAKELKRHFDKNELHSQVHDKKQYQYFVSDDVCSFSELGGIFLNKKIDGQVEKIDIEKY